MFPTQAPLFFPPTTRRPFFKPTHKPTHTPFFPSFVPSFMPTNTSFVPSFSPTNTSFVPTHVPSVLDILTTIKPAGQDQIVVSYSSQINDQFIPLNFQYALVSVSGCFLFTFFIFCLLLCCKTEIGSERDPEKAVVNINLSGPEDKHLILHLHGHPTSFRKELSSRNVYEDAPIHPLYPPLNPPLFIPQYPHTPLTRNRSLPLRESTSTVARAWAEPRGPPFGPSKTQNYYKG